MAWFGASTLLGEGKGSNSGTDDLFGDECKEDGEDSFDEGAEGRGFGRGVKKEKKRKKERKGGNRYRRKDKINSEKRIVRFVI